jgi:hypothetical protein
VASSLVKRAVKCLRSCKDHITRLGEYTSSGTNDLGLAVIVTSTDELWAATRARGSMVKSVVKCLRTCKKHVACSSEDASGGADDLGLAEAVADLKELSSALRTVGDVVELSVKALGPREKQISSGSKDISSVADKARSMVVAAGLEVVRATTRAVLGGDILESAFERFRASEEHIAGGGKDISGIADEARAVVVVASLQGEGTAAGTAVGGGMVQGIVERLRPCEDHVSSSGQDASGVLDGASVVAEVAGLDGVGTAMRAVGDMVKGVVDSLGTGK